MDLHDDNGTPRSGADIVAELLGISTEQAETARDNLENQLNADLENQLKQEKW